MQRIGECVRHIVEAENVLAHVRGVLGDISQEDTLRRLGLQVPDHGTKQLQENFRAKPPTPVSTTISAPISYDPRDYELYKEFPPAPNEPTVTSLEVGVPGVGQPLPDTPCSPSQENCKVKQIFDTKLFDTKVSVAEEAPTDMDKKLSNAAKGAGNTKYTQMWSKVDGKIEEEDAACNSLVDQVVIENVEGKKEGGKGTQDDMGTEMQSNKSRSASGASRFFRKASRKRTKTIEEWNNRDVTVERCLWGFFRLPMIHPEAKFRLAWMCIGFLFIVYEAYAIPYYLAFEVEAKGALYYFASLVNSYFILDIPMTFCTGFSDKLGNVIVKPKDVASRYLRGWFVCDVVAGVPWEWINENSDKQTASMTRSFRFVRAFKLLRLARLLRLMKLKSVVDKVQTYIEANQLITFAVGIVRVLLLLFAVTHWVACIWFVVGKRDIKENTWVKEEGLDKNDKLKCYMTSLYFSLTTMTTVGYGDIHAMNDDEIQYALAMLLVSSVAFAGLMGTLMDLISELNRQHHLLAEKKMNLSRYMHWRAVPRKLMMGIRTHLLFLWDENEGYDAYEETVKTLLPPVLKKELCYHIYGRVLCKAPFFTWMKDYIICVKELADSVQSIFLERGDHLFRLGQPNMQIYMLLTGVVVCSRNESLWDEDKDSGLVGFSSTGQDFWIPRKKETTLVELGTYVMSTTKGAAKSFGRTSTIKTKTGAGSSFMQLMGSHHQSSHQQHRKETHAVNAVRWMQNDVDERQRMEEEYEHERRESASTGIFNSEVMNAATKKLQRQDFATKVAARKVQRHFRAKLAARKRRKALEEGHDPLRTSSFPKKETPGTLRQRVTRMLSKTVEAPAYFGESCLWVEYDQWDDPARYPVYLYSARCESRGELIRIPRSAIQKIIENFSPWLVERFEFFRQAVVEGLAKKENDFAMKRVSTKDVELPNEDAAQETLAEKETSKPTFFEDSAVWDLDMPDDDTAFQAVHLQSLHRAPPPSSLASGHALRELSFEDPLLARRNRQDPLALTSARRHALKEQDLIMSAGGWHSGPYDWS